MKIYKLIALYRQGKLIKLSIETFAYRLDFHICKLFNPCVLRLILKIPIIFDFYDEIKKL